MPIFRWAEQTNRKSSWKPLLDQLTNWLTKIIILAGPFSQFHLNYCAEAADDGKNPRSKSIFSFCDNFKQVELFYPGQEYN